MAKYDTPMLDELENGPWPSFISGIKRLRDDHPDERINAVTNSLLGQLEHSYETRKGYWKGGCLSVFGYGGGIIPRFTELKNEEGFTSLFIVAIITLLVGMYQLKSYIKSRRIS